MKGKMGKSILAVLCAVIPAVVLWAPIAPAARAGESPVFKVLASKVVQKVVGIDEQWEPVDEEYKGVILLIKVTGPPNTAYFTTDFSLAYTRNGKPDRSPAVGVGEPKGDPPQIVDSGMWMFGLCSFTPYSGTGRFMLLFPLETEINEFDLLYKTPVVKGIKLGSK